MEPLRIHMGVSKEYHGWGDKFQEGGGRRGLGGENVPSPALGASAACVAKGVKDTGQGPAGAEDGAGDGEAEAGDEKGAEERGLVLGEVCVGALCCDQALPLVIPASLFLPCLLQWEGDRGAERAGGNPYRS